MFEICLRGCLAAQLQLIEIILHLLGIEFSRQAIEVKCEGGYMTAVIIKGSFTATQYGDVSFESMQQFGKTSNFTTGPIEVFVIP